MFVSLELAPASCVRITPIQLITTTYTQVDKAVDAVVLSTFTPERIRELTDFGTDV
jgi:hypothetical protein